MSMTLFLFKLIHIIFLQKNERSVNLQPKILVYNTSGEEKRMKEDDIILSAHIACHSSTNSVDHLCELLKDIGKKSFEDLKLHGTKTSMIIKNVIGKSLEEDLKKAKIV